RQAEASVQPVAVGELLQELQTLLQSDLDARNLLLETPGLNDPTTVLADRDQLRQVLFNLLQNAIAFAPEGSSIAVSLSKSARGMFRLEVSDQGPGAADEIIDSLFEPYVTKRPGGTGLGLSIVRRIAVAHDWTVGYKSGNPAGAIFWIDGIRSA
ncbi:MAG: ATP-binding protein, partial [Planctomycetaceae bacterium]|nr:ATP-binding protein [Planctomycetaceae bacterium]